MKTDLTKEQVDAYQENGYIIIDDFLSSDELEEWRHAVNTAIAERNGQKMPGKDVVVGEDDGINEDTTYFNNVFDHC